MEDIYSALQNPLKKPESQIQSKHTGIYEESLKLGEELLDKPKQGGVLIVYWFSTPKTE